MKTEQLLKLNQRQLEKMTEKELRQVVSTLRSTSRKRAERVAKTGLYSPALERLKKGASTSDYLPTIKGMDVTQLRNEYKRYKGYLKSQTSTAGGTRKANKKLKEITAQETGVSFDNADEMLQYYHLVDLAEQTDVGGVLHYRTIKEVVDEVYRNEKYDGRRGMSKDENEEFDREILDEIEKRLEEIYEYENRPRAKYPSKGYKKRK